MVGRRDTGRRGQGDVRHGSHFKDMHKNPNEHVATCMGPNSPNWQRDPTPNETATQDSCRRGPCNASPSALTNAIPSQAACHSGATRYGPLPRLPAAHKTAHSHLLAAAPSRNAGTPISKSTIAKKAKSTGKKLIDLSKLVKVAFFWFLSDICHWQVLRFSCPTFRACFRDPDTATPDPPPPPVYDAISVLTKPYAYAGNPEMGSLTYQPSAFFKPVAQPRHPRRRTRRTRCKRPSSQLSSPSSGPRTR